MDIVTRNLLCALICDQLVSNHWLLISRKRLSSSMSCVCLLCCVADRRNAIFHLTNCANRVIEFCIRWLAGNLLWRELMITARSWKHQNRLIFRPLAWVSIRLFSQFFSDGLNLVCLHSWQWSLMRTQGFARNDNCWAIKRRRVPFLTLFVTSHHYWMFELRNLSAQHAQNCLNIKVICTRRPI